MTRVLVIGIGNRFRRDDGFGPLLLDRIAAHLPPGASAVESDGEPARIIDLWADVDLAVVVDSVRFGAAPGSLIDVDARDSAFDLMPPAADSGSHTLGIATAAALGGTVGRMPRRLRIVGIEPADVGFGEGLSEPVARGLDDAVSRVLKHVRAAQEE